MWKLGKYNIFSDASRQGKTLRGTDKSYVNVVAYCEYFGVRGVEVSVLKESEKQVTQCHVSRCE